MPKLNAARPIASFDMSLSGWGTRASIGDSPALFYWAVRTVRARCNCKRFSLRFSVGAPRETTSRRRRGANLKIRSDAEAECRQAARFYRARGSVCDGPGLQGTKWPALRDSVTNCHTDVATARRTHRSRSVRRIKGVVFSMGHRNTGVKRIRWRLPV